MSIIPGVISLLALALPVLGVPAAIPRGGIHRNALRSVEERQNPAWNGYRSVGYYPDWVLYSPREFYVNDITASDFTHIIYAFANVDAASGTVFLGDPWADTQFPYPGDDTSEPGNNLYGNLKQLFKLKQANRNLKIQLGIGGATYSSNFANINTESWRQNFADSAHDLVNNLGFDGLCLDYGGFYQLDLASGLSREAKLSPDFVLLPISRTGRVYPIIASSSPTPDQSASLVDLFRRLRGALDYSADQNGGGHYLLSWAAPCGAYNWNGQDVPGMNQYLDYWNLMAYDFSGAWTDTALPASNLYPDGMSSDVGASGSQCVKHYIESGATPRKLNLGLPLYGTGFGGTEGMWTPWTDLGGGEYGTPGFYDVKSLPVDNEQVFYDSTLGASWSYNAANGHVVSFDTPTVAYQKARWVMNNHIGGMMYWSIEGDTTGRQSAGNDLERRADLESRNKKAECECEGGGGNGGNPPPSPPPPPPPSPPPPPPPIDTAIGHSLVNTVATAFRRFGGGLENHPNNIDYPNSEYDNVRAGFD